MSAPSGFPPPTKKQARILWMSVTALSVGVLLGLLGLLLWGMGFVLQLLAPVLWPLAIGGVLAYLLDPAVDYFERRMKRFWAILLVFFLCVLVLLGLLGSIVPRLVVEARDMIQDFPRYSKVMKDRINDWIEKSAWKGLERTPAATNNLSSGSTTTNVVGSAGTATNVAGTNLVQPPGQPERAAGGPRKNLWETEIGGKVLGWAEKAAPQVGAWVWGRLTKVASWGGMLIGLALVPVFTFYFLLEEERIKGAWTDYLPVQESKFKDEVVFVLNAINNYLIVFFRGQMLVAMCDGFLFTIGFLAVGLNYAVLIGVLAGLLSIVPYLGAILTIVPAVILAIVQFHDWLHPLLVIAVFSAVQALEGLVISPKIMGDRVGLHPLTIIVAVLVGTLLMGGILGGILAIPLTAALRVLMFRYVWKRRNAPVIPA